MREQVQHPPDGGDDQTPASEAWAALIGWLADGNVDEVDDVVYGRAGGPSDGARS